MTHPAPPDNDYALLVVDWDFFFPNPAYGAAIDADSILYVWDFREAPWFIDYCWPSRAAAFLEAGVPLPYCRDYENFWDRFVIRDDAPLLMGDSNANAGLLFPNSLLDDDAPEAWGTVSLWDAHHDSGYKGTYEQWEASDTVACDTWMLMHHKAGSRLEVVYPSWREKIDGVEKGPLIEVDRRIDDGTNPTTVYDAVYVCRSGAWVPSWCDHQFEEFISAVPALHAYEVPGNRWTQPRPDPLPEARASRGLHQMLEQLNQGLDPVRSSASADRGTYTTNTTPEGT